MDDIPSFQKREKKWKILMKLGCITKHSPCLYTLPCHTSIFTVMENQCILLNKLKALP